MDRLFIAIGAIAGFIAVAAGAFGAPGLKTRVDADMLAVFETGARYQMYHALALILVGLMAASRPSGLLSGAGWAFLAGMLIFSGSLYIMTFTGLRWLGAITPIGGVALLVGWALFAAAALRG